MCDEVEVLGRRGDGWICLGPLLLEEGTSFVWLRVLTGGGGARLRDLEGADCRLDLGGFGFVSIGGTCSVENKQTIQPNND